MSAFGAKVRCDECGSVDVDHYLKRLVPEPPPPPIPTMEEFITEEVRFPKWVSTVMVVNTWVLRCRTCGFSREYSVQS